MEFVKFISQVLWTLPAPNDAWAEIIGHIAWPAVVTILIVRFRRYLKIFLNTIASRLETDHVKFGMFELTPRDKIVELPSDDVGAEEPTLIPDDAEIIEAILEYVAENGNVDAMWEWMKQNLPDGFEIEDFITSNDYANDRLKMFEALIRRSE